MPHAHQQLTPEYPAGRRLPVYCPSLASCMYSWTASYSAFEPDGPHQFVFIIFLTLILKRLFR